MSHPFASIRSSATAHMRAMLMCLAPLVILAATARAQGAPDRVTLHLLAIKAVHPVPSSARLLVVGDSATTSAQDEAIAHALGGSARYVGTSATPRANDVALRAQIRKKADGLAEVLVDVWGEAATPGGKPPYPYFSRYVVTLRRQGAVWLVEKAAQEWGS
jgi:hypothetical protein